MLTTTVPVLLLFYNRPELMHGLVQRVLEASPSCLYLACDGPRHDDDWIKIERCREMAMSAPWRCEVRTRFLEDNHGCAVACSGAIGWFFENESSGIVLEDDCMPDPSFFPFATELLDRFETESSVLSISGSNLDLRPGSLRYPRSYRFCRLPFAWGWASWARAWKGYRLHLDPVHDCEINPCHLPVANRASGRGWRRRLRRVATDNLSTWDYQWTYHHLRRGGLSIIPRENLISNLTSSSATHMHRVGTWQNLPTGRMTFPLVHPPAVESDPDLDRHLDLVAYNHRPWLARKAWQFAVRNRLLSIDAQRLGRWHIRSL